MGNLGTKLYISLRKLGFSFDKFKEPTIINHSSCTLEMYKVLNQNNCSNALIVCNEAVSRLVKLNEICKSLKEHKINVTVFDEIGSRATEKLIKRGEDIYLKNKCDCIIAIGGCATIDTSKIIGARISNPSKRIMDMEGNKKLKNKLPFFIAVSSTAGSGHETFNSAYVFGRVTRDKITVTSSKLMPKYVYVDSSLLVTLDKESTAYSGLDALSKSIETYTSLLKNKRGRKYAKKAIELAFENIEASYQNQRDEERRQKMLESSYLGGLASSYLGIGYIECLSNTIGAMYDIPHGLASSILCPYILRMYGSSINLTLCRIANNLHLTPESTPDSVKASVVIDKIVELNEKMGIPDKFVNVIRDRDIPEIVEAVMEESSTLFLTPKVFTKDELTKLLKKVSITMEER